MKQPPSQWRTRLVIAVLSICVLLQALLSLADRMNWSSRTVLLCGSTSANVTTEGFPPAGTTQLATLVSSSSNSNSGHKGSSSTSNSSLADAGRTTSPLVQAVKGGRAADAAAAAAAGASTAPVILEDQRTYWDYRCWTPHNMSQPSLTLLSVVGGLPATYQLGLRTNRLVYCARHGYRYCELYTKDKHRVPAWSKLPWMLALAPCTEYMMHVDADAMLFNHSLSVAPIMQYMQATGTDQLLPQDNIAESPLNYGVFMTRSQPWVWAFYKRLYNHCPCDWSRMNDWPAEQGIIYDLIAGNLSSWEALRSRIVSSRGWNSIMVDEQLPQASDLIVHLTHPRRFPPNSGCEGLDTNHRCKYLALEYYLKEFVSKGYTNPGPSHLAAAFTVTNQTCQRVRADALFEAGISYSNRKDKIETSVMDFDVDATGRVAGIKVGQIGCVGWRGDSKCRLPRLWDKSGTGPWSSNGDNVMQGPPRRGSQQQKQQKQQQRHHKQQ